MHQTSFSGLRTWRHFPTCQCNTTYLCAFVHLTRENKYSILNMSQFQRLRCLKVGPSPTYREIPVRPSSCALVFERSGRKTEFDATCIGREFGVVHRGVFHLLSSAISSSPVLRRTALAGTPATIVIGSTLLLTTAPAATTNPCPHGDAV